jgi:hypothetical protein
MSKEDCYNPRLSAVEQSHYRMINKLLNKIEQELIAEIKKEFGNLLDNLQELDASNKLTSGNFIKGKIDSYSVAIKILIGDTE